MNSSVVKLTDTYYVDERQVSSIGRTSDKDNYWTIVNVQGAETYVDLPIEEVLRLIHWQ